MTEMFKTKNELNPSFMQEIFRENIHPTIDLLAILQKSLDRAIFLYNFIHEVR